MSVTNATEDGYRPIKGADHNHPCYHYKLTAGTAYALNQDLTIKGEVAIDDAQVRRAESTHILCWRNGKTVIVFDLDGGKVAQPLPLKTGKPPPGKSKEAASVAAPKRKIRYDPL